MLAQCYTVNYHLRCYFLFKKLLFTECLPWTKQVTSNPGLFTDEMCVLGNFVKFTEDITARANGHTDKKTD